MEIGGLLSSHSYLRDYKIQKNEMSYLKYIGLFNPHSYLLKRMENLEEYFDLLSIIDSSTV